MSVYIQRRIFGYMGVAFMAFGCEVPPSAVTDAGEVHLDGGVDGARLDRDSGDDLDGFIAPSDDGGPDASEVVDAWLGIDAYVEPCWSECPDAGFDGRDAGADRDTGGPLVDAGTDARPASSDGGSPPDTTPVIQLALGDTHSCLLRSSGRVACWGNPSFVGWPAPALLDATDVAAVISDADPLVSEGVYSYATRRDASVWRWEGTGANLTDREWPGGPLLSMPAEPPMPTAMYAPGESFPLPTGDYVEIYAGLVHTCGRRMDGSVWCWGRNELSQLGRATDPFLTDRHTAFTADEVLLVGRTDARDDDRRRA